MTNTVPASQDPRWIKFNSEGYQCSCGERHVGLFPISMHIPVGWTGSGDYQSDFDLRTDGDFLSSSFCVWGGKNFAIRMRVYLPVKGAQPAAFLIAAWVGVDKLDFDAFSAEMLKPSGKPKLRARARLLNRLSRFPDTYYLNGTAIMEQPNELPVMMAHGLQADMRDDHTLIVQQREGIDVDRVFELFTAYKHDMGVGK